MQHWHFWVPLLALYTGSRQSPIAALRCDDLRQTESGIWYVHILKDKTESGARRNVPLHDFIVEELNFPAFVERQKSLGHETIFQIKPKAGRAGQRVSRWWRETFIGTPKKRVELSPAGEGRRKTFHSFRSTLINAAKQAGADIRKIEETVGHADPTGKREKSMSGDQYAEDYLVEIRYEDVIKPVHFPVEDMVHLKRSKYVIR